MFTKLRMRMHTELVNTWIGYALDLTENAHLLHFYYITFSFAIFTVIVLLRLG